MPLLTLECQNCHKIFSSGISFGVGASATLANNKARCPFCGSLENIPNGAFKATVDGFVDILKDSKNPLKDAKDILNKLEKKGNLSNIPSKDKIERILQKNKLKITVAIAVLEVIINLLSKNPSTKIDNIIINQAFYTEYNQIIEIVKK